MTKKFISHAGLRGAIRTSCSHVLFTISDIGEKLAKKMSSTENKRETEWCITLVNHLLKELSVNRQYRIDMQSKFKVETCSCCSESVYYDDCSFGK